MREGCGPAPKPASFSLKTVVLGKCMVEFSVGSLADEFVIARG